MKKVLFSWSGGKDSSFALYQILKDSNYQIVAILTTVTLDYQRISMHGVREILLEKQSQSLNLPLEKVYIKPQISNEEYEKQMMEMLLKYKNIGVDSVVFGDIFLEDIRKYRESQLAKLDMKAIFPLWGKTSKDIANLFIECGFKAIVVCIDSHLLDKRFIGRYYDKDFLEELPENVDPCGENGEFHTFVYDGPIFQNPISFKTGDIVLRENRFYYIDLLP